MYTVAELVQLLHLSTEHQVRNRINAVRDLLAGFIRRGPNNQMLVTEEGLAVLRDLQALVETGHTLAEASRVIRFRQERENDTRIGVVNQGEQNQVKAEEGEGWSKWVEHLAEDLRRLEERVAALEASLRERRQVAWWERWR